MAVVSNTPRPGYAWDATDNVWYPIGTGTHSHSDYITQATAISPTLVDAKGDIIAASAADTVARLAVGANDTVLTADSSTATGLKWATPAAGGMTLISEQTLSASTGYSFTSIPGDYKQLMLVWSGIYHSTTSTIFDVRLNANSGSNYLTSWTKGQNTSFEAGTNTKTSVTNNDDITLFGNNVTQSVLAGAGQMAQGFLIIDNYSSATKYKKYWSQVGYYDNSFNKFLVTNGTFIVSTAITSLDITRLSGTATLNNLANTSVRLYGVS